MSRLFGNPEDFGIEAGLEPDGHIATTLWGHMQIWCRGHRLGSMDERYCAIGQSYASFRNLVPQLDSLWSTEFESRSDEEILTFLDDALYREPIAHDVPDRTALKVAADAALAWGRFDLLSNWGPQFDECRAFILCPPGDDIVILSRNLPEDAGIRVSVTRTSFLLATEGFIRWFEDESRRLAIPY